MSERAGASEETTRRAATSRRWRRVLGVIVAFFFLAGLVMLIDVWNALGSVPRGDRLRRVEASPNYVNGEFVNTVPTEMKTWDATVKWFGSSTENTAPESAINVSAPQRADFDTPPESGLRVTWFGHSTVLVEIDGVRLLTDPIWSERVSPSSFVGPKRFFAPPMALDELPELDAVVISHDHFDHLDMTTVQALAERELIFFVPLGVGAHLESWEIEPERIVELDWWESASLGALELVCTPARHFSGRLPGRSNTTLWAGWAMLGPENRVFFSGDSGMSPDFATIGERYGPFALSMLDTGAYDSTWADYHMGPEQAVEATRALGAKTLLPIHWGTLKLALHSWTEPMERALVAGEKAGVLVLHPRPGSLVEPSRYEAEEPWWPSLPWKTAEDSPIISSGLGGDTAGQ